jgi:hypothetical protein
MRAELPFSVYKRGGRKTFLVRFKNKAGLPAVNTKQTTKQAAIEAAYGMLRDGVPAKAGGYQ